MSTEEHRFTIISYKIRTEKGRISDGIRCISPVPEQFIRKRIPVPEVVERKPELPAGAFRFQFGAAAAVRPEHIDPIIAGQPHRQPDDRAVMSRLYSLRDASRQTAVRPAKTPTEAKIWALWYELKGYLPKQEQTLAYLLGFVRRAAGNQDVKEAGDLAGLTGKESYNVIEALKRRLEQERATVAQEVPF